MVGLAGFVDSIGGGGGLISLPAYIMSGIPVHQALATNKLSSSLGSSVASFHYWKMGYMKPLICIPCVVLSLTGAFFGSNLTLKMDEKILALILIIILPLIALYVIFGKTLSDCDTQRFSMLTTVAVCSATAFVIGFYDGFYGPGTGTFLMIVFSGLCRLSLKDSAGTTKAVNFSSNIMSLAVFVYNGQVMYPLGLCAGVSSMIGCYIGSHLFSARGSRITRPIILCVLAVFLVKTVIQIF